jgi:VWFA-related protein
MRRLVLAALVWLTSSAAQQTIPPDEFQLEGAVYTPPSQAPIVVETRLVEVGVVVRDGKGHPVHGLTRDDFTIEDQGKKREITAFSVENGAPPQAALNSGLPMASPAPQAPARRRFLALVFDDFSMAPAELIPVRAAAQRFAAEGLGANGLASVFFVSRGQVVPFTSDPAKLEDAITHLTLRNREAGMNFCPYINTYEGFLITEHNDPMVLNAKVAEAISCGLCQPRDPSCGAKVQGMARSVWAQAQDTSRRTMLFLNEIVKYMAQMPGERVVVLASAGFISQTMEFEREELIDHALKADVVIHSLDAKGLFTQDLGLSGPSMSMASVMLRQSMGTRSQDENNDSLAVIAESTGGLFFHNNNDLALGFHELGLAPEVSYTLGFSPEGKPDRSYHKLKVRLTAKGHYSVQARHGYFSADAPPPPPPPQRAIDRELLAESTPNGVPVRLIDAASAVDSKHEPALHVVLQIDTPRLTFTTAGSRHDTQLTILAALFDDRGGFVVGREARATFALKDDTMARLTDGQNIGILLPAAPGKYRLRCVIQEGNGGKLTAATRAVELLAPK